MLMPTLTARQSIFLKRGRGIFFFLRQELVRRAATPGMPWSSMCKRTLRREHRRFCNNVKSIYRKRRYFADILAKHCYDMRAAVYTVENDFTDGDGTVLNAIPVAF